MPEALLTDSFSEIGNPWHPRNTLCPIKEAQAHAPDEEAFADKPTAADKEVPEVLVVDDKAEMRDYLQDLLGTQYRAVTASDGTAGISRLQERTPNLVISDAVMPECDGIDIRQAIRNDEQLQHLPVILPIAWQDSENRLSGLRLGSVPPHSAGLTARVENLIRIRGIVRDRVPLSDWMDPNEATVSSEEAEFLDALDEAVDEMELSARHFWRRIEDTTGLSAAGFIRT